MGLSGLLHCQEIWPSSQHRLLSLVESLLVSDSPRYCFCCSNCWARLLSTDYLKLLGQAFGFVDGGLTWQPGELVGSLFSMQSISVVVWYRSRASTKALAVAVELLILFFASYGRYHNSLHYSCCRLYHLFQPLFSCTNQLVHLYLSLS